WVGYIYRSPAEAAQMAPVTRVSMRTHQHAMAVVHANVNRNLTGEQLFKTLGCTECHTVNGKPSNKQGPDLAIARGNNRSHDWLYIQITAPQTHNPTTIMPPFSDLSDHNVELLIKYLEGLQAPKPAAQPPPPPPSAAGGAANKAALIKYGEQLVNTQGCLQCHTIQGRPSNKVGPDLIMAVKKDKPSKDWLKVQLMTPQAHNPMSIMPSFATRLNDQQTTAVVEFLSSLTTRKLEFAAESEGTETQAQTLQQGGTSPVASINIIGDKDHGAILFHQSCIMCHGPQGNPKTPGFLAPKGVPRLNPIDRAVFNKDPQLFVNHIDQFIQHGAPNIEGGPKMPDFGDSHSLTQAQIADLEAYVLSLNGVDRTMIMNPGIDPKTFFYTLIWITSVIIMLAAVYWFIVKTLKV
ncbi:MAG: c-type cytochrome, partial [Candidatus Omnitrophica bacterium]|nr:c-type cytochrome [Candidatus Omnitrophota bacterium]